mgnify:CR=1 FL=1|jgi:hypothetical protein
MSPIRRKLFGLVDNLVNSESDLLMISRTPIDDVGGC